MGLVGLEPTISPLWAARFNQFNYKPNRISTCPSEWTSRVDLCSYSFFLFPSPPSVGFFLCEALPTSYRLAPDARRVDLVFATSVSPWSDLEERSPLISFIQCLQWGATHNKGGGRPKKSELDWMLHRDQQLTVKTRQEEVGGSGGENGLRTRDFWRDRPAL